MTPAELLDLWWQACTARCVQKGYTADHRLVIVLFHDDEIPDWVPDFAELWTTPHHEDERKVGVIAKHPHELQPGGFPNVWVEWVTIPEILFPEPETADN